MTIALNLKRLGVAALLSSATISARDGPKTCGKVVLHKASNVTIEGAAIQVATSEIPSLVGWAESADKTKVEFGVLCDHRVSLTTPAVDHVEVPDDAVEVYGERRAIYWNSVCTLQGAVKDNGTAHVDYVKKTDGSFDLKLRDDSPGGQGAISEFDWRCGAANGKRGEFIPITIEDGLQVGLRNEESQTWWFAKSTHAWKEELNQYIAFEVRLTAPGSGAEGYNYAECMAVPEYSNGKAKISIKRAGNAEMLDVEGATRMGNMPMCKRQQVGTMTTAQKSMASKGTGRVPGGQP